MRKVILLSTTIMIAPFMAGDAWAQCVATQDCASLGYTEASCPNGGIKCPFGNMWSCKKENCDASYQYTCTGTNEQPGTAVCGGKYKECKCTGDYEWKDGKCQTKGGTLGKCTGYAKNCFIGQILNSDGTCTTNKESGKTPIGVVVYISGDNCGQALALNDLGNMYWSTETIDIPDLPNYTSEFAAEKDFDSCDNTQKIIKQGTSTYPAAWAAVNYAPSSVPVTTGKWCLPAAGVARSMMNNYSAINSGLSKAGGEALPAKSNHDHWNWLSSERTSYSAWAWCFACGDLGNFNKDSIRSSYGYVRPVLVF